MEIIISGIALVLAFLLTLNLRKYALKKNIIDVPNERSSHKVPTPRGGGVSFVITSILSFIGLCLYSSEYVYLWPLFAGSALIAAVGFWDDHSDLSSKFRLFLHIGISAITIFLLAKTSNNAILKEVIESQYILFLFFISALTFYINLYNFMDGIDGIASIQTITVFLSAFILHQSLEAESVVTGIYLIISAGVIGFLLLNFPPAKIFMGDAGSGFLGFTIGAFTFYSLGLGWPHFWAWVILSAVFVGDATYTIFKRIRNKEDITKPHRSHAYQIASRKFNSHKKVTLSVLIINVFYLLPVAYMTLHGKVNLLVGIALGYLPILAIVYAINAIGKDSE